MTRPVAILAVLVLFLNDHVLKRAWPGLLTGKLSDVAGMIFFPLLLVTLAWPFVPRSCRTDRFFDRMLVVACAATAVVFAATKTIPIANDAYRVTWGILVWPLRAAHAVARGTSMPGLACVQLVRDPTDLVAVPFVLVALLTGRRRARGRVGANESPRTTTALRGNA
jgi:hypothetical protein